MTITTTTATIINLIPRYMSHKSSHKLDVGLKNGGNNNYFYLFIYLFDSDHKGPYDITHIKEEVQEVQ